ncbi:MAG: phospho-N-acetylmuramoyl-pentapeptide-transferase [Aphanocapsa sp. GSE-SYN-MK-11-07L]|jgi:phospho-N-acetylmuramoyl-pentapeptide-transferase|nr:phospho-N-acetylmuramoyl-pentapeptide-transferase [Aphanocapsa sp. GSE-SYN-MK-11-07L]
MKESSKLPGDDLAEPASAGSSPIAAQTEGWSVISGKGLFFLLLAGLSLAAIGLDASAGRFATPGATLTLPVWVSALVAAGTGFVVVPLLRALKTGQVIREDGPQSHGKKSGTPTMGGIFFIPAALVVANIWSALLQVNHPGEVVAASALTLFYGFIGWLDDWQVLRKKSNQGISAKFRLGLEVSSAALFCLWLGSSHPEITNLQLPWGLVLPLGLLFWPLAVFVPTAQSNAINLTDGLDGLAAGTSAIALLGLAALVAPISPGLMIFAACLSGGCLGFLAHNRNPAQVFMGDTGSLALGGGLAAIGLISNSLWGLFILSGVFLAETISVIAQVSYYKATKGPDGKGKRLFKMAPLHHHFELSGWSEIKVVATFYSATALLCLLCLSLAYFS